MKVTLDSPIVINRTVSEIELTDFSFDEERREMHIAYEFKDDTSRGVTPRYVTLETADALALLARADVIAASLGGNYRGYKAVRRAALEHVLGVENLTGTISG